MGCAFRIARVAIASRKEIDEIRICSVAWYLIRMPVFRISPDLDGFRNHRHNLFTFSVLGHPFEQVGLLLDRLPLPGLRQRVIFGSPDIYGCSDTPRTSEQTDETDRLCLQPKVDRKTILGQQPKNSQFQPGLDLNNVRSGRFM